MPELSLYVQHSTLISTDQIKTLAQDVLGASGEVIGTSETDLEIRFPNAVLHVSSELTGQDLIEHISDFQDFVRRMAGPNADQVQELIEDIGLTQMVIDITVDPDFDPEHRIKSLLISMACTYERCLIYYDDAIWSPYGEMWFGPQDAQPFVDLSNLQVRKLPPAHFPTMSTDQKERYHRIANLMAPKNVPEPDMQRIWVPDVNDTTLRTPAEVARRILAMHAVVCIARGRPRGETISELEASGADDALTPDEQAFLNHPAPSEEQSQTLIWRLESLWLLMWSLRHIDKFSWPSEMCDVDGLHDLIFAKSKDPRVFIENASIRSKKSILDAAQLTIQLQSVVRSAVIDQEAIPANLNWANPDQHVSAMECPAPGIITERHYALNWLLRFDDADWDDVDIPTVPYAINLET